jgi:N-hydroxyarylamine O-acetyltransferase
VKKHRESRFSKDAYFAGLNSFSCLFDGFLEVVDIYSYIQRINYNGPLEPTINTLSALHRAHMLSVPFENLDIPLGRRIELDEASLFDKIVHRRRGGFCYELNGLFAALLCELGFNVQRLSARVANSQGGFGSEFDHMTLLVQLEERLLADVGFGDSFFHPLRLDERGDQIQGANSYRIRDDGDHLTYLRLVDGEWHPQYIFRLQPYAIADFIEGCNYAQTSPESSFTRRRVCSRLTPKGRITLSDRKLIIKSNGLREEIELENEEEVETVLYKEFGISL